MSGGVEAIAPRPRRLSKGAVDGLCGDGGAGGGNPRKKPEKSARRVLGGRYLTASANGFGQDVDAWTHVGGVARRVAKARRVVLVRALCRPCRTNPRRAYRAMRLAADARHLRRSRTRRHARRRRVHSDVGRRGGAQQGRAQGAPVKGGCVYHSTTCSPTLRSDGFTVGVVIDEAHLNFGASAHAAAEFYLEALQPDFSILATATPNDDKLEQFEKSARIEVASRIVIGREEVVLAGLNKYGLMLGYLRFQPGDEELIDIEQGTLTAGWSQHQLIKSRLAEKGITVTPLMLVQVEDQASGDESPVDRVKAKLLEIGVPESAIAVHTSGEPDPEFIRWPMILRARF